jgi:formamidopyrimidine-DNA glycosylase
VPELPDVTVYIEALTSRIQGQQLLYIRLQSPFWLRSVTPPLSNARGRIVQDIRRVGKRIAIGLDNGGWLVIHLMIAGRLHWKKPAVKLASRRDLGALDFAEGTLTVTEAGTKRRSSLHYVEGETALAALDPGGLEVLESSSAEFAARLTHQNHTLKRALTDPRIFSGIGNAYSDEILHSARLSPVQLTQNLSEQEIDRLYEAVRTCLTVWTERLRVEASGQFPENVTAFRPEMAVHGKYGQPCPVCASKVQRIRYAENETNYCPGCQTGGKLLADRSLSRLLKSDWPRTADEWERAIAERSTRGSDPESEKTSLRKSR